MPMTLITTTNLTLDGVVQGLGGPDEDRRGGFDRGGWAPPLADSDVGEYLDHVYPGAAAFLFGRFTSEIFAGSKHTAPYGRRNTHGPAQSSTPQNPRQGKSVTTSPCTYSSASADRDQPGIAHQRSNDPPPTQNLKRTRHPSPKSSTQPASGLPLADCPQFVQARPPLHNQ